MFDILKFLVTQKAPVEDIKAPLLSACARVADELEPDEFLLVAASLAVLKVDDSEAAGTDQHQLQIAYN